MFEIIIFIFVILAAFIGVALYARYSSQKRARKSDLDLDHLEPEINLDNEFNSFFEQELQQQSIGDLDSEPAVSLSAEAETIRDNIEPVIKVKEELDSQETAPDKEKPSTINVVIDDDDIDSFDATSDYQEQKAPVQEASSANIEDFDPVEAEEIEPKAPRKDSDDLVIALTIMAAENTRFSGKAIKEALETQNLHFGDLQIYHRFTAGSHKQSIFSIANILDPGTLLPDQFATLMTPGLLIFARLPGPVNGLALFDDLLETAQSITERLQGTLCDDSRQPISQASLEDMRSRIFNLNFALHTERNNDYSN